MKYMVLLNSVAYYCLMNYIVLSNLQLWHEHQQSVCEGNTKTKQTDDIKKKGLIGDAIKLLKKF
jgi:hypothetical protein